MFDRAHLSTRPPRAASPVMGIWRTGERIRQGHGTDLFVAQPADSLGNPRYDYVLKTAVGDAQDARSRIARSIRAAHLTHPNLIAILDASDSGISPYVVMPRLEAEGLDVRIQKIEDFAVPVALWWARQAAQALQTLHAHDWIHGDVQPQNLLIDDKGHVTLIDLGSAERVHAPLPRLYRGTPNYASPELVAGTTAALPAMDIFALGRVLWECLAAATPRNGVAVERIAELIEHMVALEPVDRPTAQEVVQRLLQLEIETLGGHFGPTAIRRAA